MTVYAMPQASDESRIQRLRNARRWLIVSLVPLLLIAFYLCLNSTGRAAELYRALSIGSLVVLVNLWNPFRRRNYYEEIAKKLHINSIEIDSDGVRMNGATWSKFIPRNELTRIDEPLNGRGMYVRTRSRFAWYVIPRQSPCYEEMKAELAATGIPIVQTSAPTNWGIFFVFLFCASLPCNILTQDRRILAVNFVLALILGVAGAILTNSGIGDSRFKRLSMLGCFLPAAFSAVSLIFPFGIK
jgi:hypothetical protein